MGVEPNSGGLADNRRRLTYDNGRTMNPVKSFRIASETSPDIDNSRDVMIQCFNKATVEVSFETDDYPVSETN
jgi:hypothetical protein